MGRGLFDNMYNGAYAYSQPRYYRPRGAPEVHPYYNRAAQEPLPKKVVKTIPVMDGNEAPVSVVPEAPVPAVPVKPRFESEDAAATKIQAVYRGYCVRKTQPLKHLKVIKAVKGELETFKNKFQETEQEKKLCSDSQERLRWAEGIMALLLRLDSLQGVHPEVRLIRKALTKELLMFQETIDTLSMDSAQLNRQEDVSTTDNSGAPQDAEITDADAQESVVTDAAAPQEAEGIDAAPEVVESMDINGSSAEQESSRAVQDMGAIEVFESDVKEHVPKVPLDINNEVVISVANENQSGSLLFDESMIGEGSVVEPNSIVEAHTQVPMDVESNKEQILTTLPAQEVEAESGASLPNAGDNQGAEAETAASASKVDDNQEDGFVFVAPSGDVTSEPEDASVTCAEQADDMGRSGEEDTEVEAETPAPETIRSGDASAEGCIVPVTTSLPPACMESQGPPTSGLSDRALLLQVLEENRKLRDVVGKVLQWGKHQNDTIHDLTCRIEQLEQHQPPLKVLRGEEADGRKKVVPNGRRAEKGRRSAKVGHKRLLLREIDSEDCLSTESDEYF